MKNENLIYMDRKAILEVKSISESLTRVLAVCLGCFLAPDSWAAQLPLSVTLPSIASEQGGHV